MRVHTPTDLGLLIRQRRRALGLSQQVLARKAGVGREWLIDVEKGKPRAEVGLLLRTLLALDLRLSVEPVEAAPSQSAPLTPEIDVDAIIRRARGEP